MSSPTNSDTPVLANAGDSPETPVDVQAQQANRRYFGRQIVAPGGLRLHDADLSGSPFADNVIIVPQNAAVTPRSPGQNQNHPMFLRQVASGLRTPLAGNDAGMQDLFDLAPSRSVSPTGSRSRSRSQSRSRSRSNSNSPRPPPLNLARVQSDMVIPQQFVTYDLIDRMVTSPSASPSGGSPRGRRRRQNFNRWSNQMESLTSNLRIDLDAVNNPPPQRQQPVNVPDHVQVAGVLVPRSNAIVAQSPVRYDEQKEEQEEKQCHAETPSASGYSPSDDSSSDSNSMSYRRLAANSDLNNVGVIALLPLALGLAYLVRRCLRKRSSPNNDDFDML